MYMESVRVPSRSKMAPSILMGPTTRSTWARRERVAASTSGWAYRAETTATPAMPLPASSATLPAPMPPMATTGMSTAAQMAFRVS